MYKTVDSDKIYTHLAPHTAAVSDIKRRGEGKPGSI